MKRTLPYFIVGSFALVVYVLVFSVKKPSSKIQLAKEEAVLIQLENGILSEEFYDNGLEELNNNELKRLLLDFGIVSIKSVFKHRYDENGVILPEIKSSEKLLMRNWYVIQPLEKYNADLLVEKLMDCEKIIVAMVNRPLRLEFDAVPNDTNYGVQWHLNNPSQPQFDIRAQGAWDINKGRNDVIIAVLDGGVDYNHPDLDPGDRSRVIAGIDTGDGDNVHWTTYL